MTNVGHVSSPLDLSEEVLAPQTAVFPGYGELLLEATSNTEGN